MGRGAARWQAHEWTPVLGTRIHAAIAARPPVSARAGGQVVLVGGLGCSYRYFGRLAAELSGAARVAAVDLPGRGLTASSGRDLDVRDLSSVLADWLRSTGRDGSVLIGHSAGCHVMADLALHARDVAGPIVLVSPVVGGRCRPWPWHLVGLARDMLADGPRTWGTWIALLVDVLGSGPVRVVRQFERLLEDPLPATARRLPVPAVVVRGSRDPVSPPDLAGDITGAAPGSRLVEVPGAGHLVHWTHARAVADAVVPLLALDRRP